jgi:hypothetical protein
VRNIFRDSNLFEQEVRRIASALWNPVGNQGSEFIAGRERDGVFFTPDVIHIVECTISDKVEKTRQDLRKTEKAIELLRRTHPNRTCKGWLITLNDPTAHQRAEAKNSPATIELVSLEDFRSKLINARAYLDERSRYPFGSVRDPVTNQIPEHTLRYIPNRITQVSAQSPIIAERIARNLAKGTGRYILLGDYGVGKSMT